MMGDINHAKYKIGDRVLFDYLGKSFTDKKGIWSGIIVEVNSLYTIEFDGVVYPEGITTEGPQDHNIMRINFPKDLRPRIYNPMVDDFKTSKWKEQIETHRRLEREDEIRRRATFIIGQNVSYKKFDYRMWVLEYQNGIITSINDQTPILTVRNNNGTEDHVAFNDVIDLSKI